MSAPTKAVPDVTVYVEDYAAFLSVPMEQVTSTETVRWDNLWSKLSASQRAKLVQRAQAFNDEMRL